MSNNQQSAVNSSRQNFIKRFKGKTSAMNKDGPLRMVQNSLEHPIEKISQKQHRPIYQQYSLGLKYKNKQNSSLQPIDNSHSTSNLLQQSRYNKPSSAVKQKKYFHLKNDSRSLETDQRRNNVIRLKQKESRNNSTQLNSHAGASEPRINIIKQSLPNNKYFLNNNATQKTFNTRYPADLSSILNHSNEGQEIKSSRILNSQQYSRGGIESGENKRKNTEVYRLPSSRQFHHRILSPNNNEQLSQKPHRNSKKLKRKKSLANYSVRNTVEQSNRKFTQEKISQFQNSLSHNHNRVHYNNNNIAESQNNILIDAEAGMLANGNNNYSMNDISYLKKQIKQQQEAYNQNFQNVNRNDENARGIKNSSQERQVMKNNATYSQLQLESNINTLQNGRKYIGNGNTPHKGRSIQSKIPQLPNIHQASNPYLQEIQAAQNRKLSSPNAKKNSNRNKKNKINPISKGKNKNFIKEEIVLAHQYQSQGQLGKMQTQNTELNRQFQKKMQRKQRDQILKKHKAKLKNLEYLDPQHGRINLAPPKFSQLEADTGGSINKNYHQARQSHSINSDLYRNNENIDFRNQIPKPINSLNIVPSIVASNNITPKPLDMLSGIKTDPHPYALDDQMSICSKSYKKSNFVNTQIDECQKKGKYYELGGLGPNLGTQAQIIGQYKLDTIKEYSFGVRKGNQNLKKKGAHSVVDITKSKRNDIAYEKEDGINSKNPQQFEIWNMIDSYKTSDSNPMS